MAHIDPADNRIRFQTAASIMPTEKDQEKFTQYLLAILMNYVDEDTWAYAIGQAFKCWAELNEVHTAVVQ